jgi:hypothetical protein
VYHEAHEPEARHGLEGSNTLKSVQNKKTPATTTGRRVNVVRILIRDYLDGVVAVRRIGSARSGLCCRSDCSTVFH